MLVTTKTTDLKTIRKNPSKFTWGKVIKIHDVGPYTIVEYRENSEGSSPNFHPYVDGNDCFTGAITLEGAIILAIARKNLTNRTDGEAMARAASKLLDCGEG